MEAFFILLILLSIIYYYKKISLFSVVDLFVCFYIFSVITTIIYQYYFPRSVKFNFYNLDFISNKKFINGLYIFTKTISYFVLGVVICFFFDKDYRNTFKKNPVSYKLNFSIAKANSKQLFYVTLFFLITCIILMLYDYGFDILRREEYIIEKNKIAQTLFKLFVLIVSFLSALLYRHFKPYSIFSLVLTIIMCLGYGSRFASVCLIIFLFVIFINSTRKTLFVFIWFPIVFLFFGYNIALRGEANGHGLIPYAIVTYEKPLVLLKYSLENFYYSFIFGFYITSETFVKYTHTNFSYVITAINPLPGKFTNWYSISKKLHLYSFVPYTLIGEVSRYPIFQIFYFTTIGYYFALIDKKINDFLKNKNIYMPLVLLTLCALFTISSYEYNFRSSHRFIWYSMFVLVLYKIFKFLPKKPNEIK